MDAKKVLFTITLLLTTCVFTNAIDEKILEIKSMFLFNFPKHIRWEDSDKAEIIFGIYNNYSAFKFLKNKLDGKRTSDKIIKVIEVNTPSEANSCMIIYAPESNQNDVASFFELVSKKNKLLISDYDMIEKGADICFYVKSGRLNFLISKTNLEQSGLKVTNQLLELGTPV